MNKILRFANFSAIILILVAISPTISIDTNTLSSNILGAEFSIINTAYALEGRNKNHNNNKNTNVNKNKNKNTNTNTNINKNTNTNTNVNSNKNTNVNINVNNDNKRRGPRPIAMLAGMAIGTVVVASAMSPSCKTVMVNGNTYKQCDDTYFQKSGVDYIVVKSPY